MFRRAENKTEYLLLHYRSNHWDFPKGHQEIGENDELTLRRETEEETGIVDLKIIPNFKMAVRYLYRANGKEKDERNKENKALNVWKKVIFYIAETKAEKVKISYEHSGFEWLEYDAALEKITYKNAKNVLRKADKFLNIAKSKSFL